MYCAIKAKWPEDERECRRQCMSCRVTERAAASGEPLHVERALHLPDQALDETRAEATEKAIAAMRRSISQ